jgi:hypothetical protein
LAGDGPDLKDLDRWSVIKHFVAFWAGWLGRLRQHGLADGEITV